MKYHFSGTTLPDPRTFEFQFQYRTLDLYYRAMGNIMLIRDMGLERRRVRHRHQCQTIEMIVRKVTGSKVVFY